MINILLDYTYPTVTDLMTILYDICDESHFTVDYYVIIAFHLGQSSVAYFYYIELLYEVWRLIALQTVHVLYKTVYVSCHYAV